MGIKKDNFFLPTATWEKLRVIVFIIFFYIFPSSDTTEKRFSGAIINLVFDVILATIQVPFVPGRYKMFDLSDYCGYFVLTSCCKSPAICGR